MGFVYKINLPDGLFYIGHTSKNLRTRLNSHINDKYSNVGDYIRELGISIDHLEQITQVIYCDWDSEFYEISIIYKNRFDKNMINSKIRKNKPSYSNWLNSSRDISLNCSSTREFHYKTDYLLSEFDQDFESMIDYLFNLYKEKNNK